MKNCLNLILTRNPGDIYESIISIRRESYYSSPFDNRYWDGGIYKILDKNIMENSHNEDLNSHFALAFSEDGELQAYSRFSINQEISRYSNSIIITNDSNVVFIHVIIARSSYRGRELNWIINDTLKYGKIGSIIYNEIFNFSIKNESNLAIADICIYPNANIPSLAFHKKIGFISLGGDHGLISTTHDNGYPIQMIRLIKVLSEGNELYRLPNGCIQIN